VAFTNHKVHPGTASTFEDISFRDVFCSKSGATMKFDPAQPGPSNRALFWFEAPAAVSNLTISGFHRTENLWAADNILIDSGVTVERLQLHDVTVINNSPGPIHVITNRGSIGSLQMSAVYAKAGEKAAGGAVVSNQGTIRQSTLRDISTVNVSPEILERH
ncbi:MAG: hypothetical protein ABFD60_16990, partial [Bryobacteraceae bacterium]